MRRERRENAEVLRQHSGDKEIEAQQGQVDAEGQVQLVRSKERVGHGEEQEVAEREAPDAEGVQEFHGDEARQEPQRGIREPGVAVRAVGEAGERSQDRMKVVIRVQRGRQQHRHDIYKDVREYQLAAHAGEEFSVAAPVRQVAGHEEEERHVKGPQERTGKVALFEVAEHDEEDADRLGEVDPERAGCGRGVHGAAGEAFKFPPPAVRRAACRRGPAGRRPPARPRRPRARSRSSVPRI